MNKNRIIFYRATISSVTAALLVFMLLGPNLPVWSGTQEMRWVDSKGVEQVLYKGSYALLIGASAYENWPKLESIPDELRSVEEVLTAQGFTVTLKLNPKSKELQQWIEEFINAHGYKSYNRLLVFYAGHGHTWAEENRGYLIPVDAPLPARSVGDPGATFHLGTLQISQIVEWSRQMTARHVLFVFDSCFSGAIFKTRTLPRPATDNLFDSASQKVRQFITSGSANEEVPAVSIFTPLFVEALKNGTGDLNDDDYVTGAELGLHLYQQVPVHGPQTPQFGNHPDPKLSKGDFVFALTLPDEPDLGILSDKSDQDCDVCPRMVAVPTGKFMMGSTERELGHRPNESPVHKVTINYPFRVSKYEISVAEWNACVADGDCTKVPRAEGQVLPTSPKVYVSWHEASDYTKWLSQKAGMQYRLLTESEWEYVTRAGSSTSYWWGHNVGEGFAVCSACGSPWDQDRPVAASEEPFEENGFGLVHSLGNVYEWVEDCYKENYEGAPTDGTAWMTGNCQKRVVRGGSFQSPIRTVLSAN